MDRASSAGERGGPCRATAPVAPSFPACHPERSIACGGGVVAGGCDAQSKDPALSGTMIARHRRDPSTPLRPLGHLRSAQDDTEGRIGPRSQTPFGSAPARPRNLPPLVPGTTASAERNSISHGGGVGGAEPESRRRNTPHPRSATSPLPRVPKQSLGTRGQKRLAAAWQRGQKQGNLPTWLAANSSFWRSASSS